MKIYLDASPRTRAWRRYKQLQAAGTPKTFEEVLSDTEKRDRKDSTRPVAPLKRAPDAHYIDASDLTPEDVVLQVTALVDPHLEALRAAS